MNKQVIINQADLDKLEEARCALFDFLEEKGLTEGVTDLVKITNIAQRLDYEETRTITSTIELIKASRVLAFLFLSKIYLLKC